MTRKISNGERHARQAASKLAANPRAPISLPAFEPTHPGEIVREHIDALDINKSDVADALSIERASLYGLINKRWGVAAPMAVKLSIVFGGSPTFWMNLQRNYDLWHALRDVDTRVLKPLYKKISMNGD